MPLSDEIARRRTFAIISHPDAGKTTLTEKLLLYGGAIRAAGSVKARKTERYAVSDWMEIEKQRGISVTTSVMQFDYDGYRINILDTPGHQDFSEDTYRTLAAADSAVMLIDGARGVQEQTIKLFKVCRMRGIPIFTFVNKMDRASRDPFDLMDELEKVLGIRSCPMNWPIGIHGDLQGVYLRNENAVELYESRGDHGAKQVEGDRISLDDPNITDVLDESYLEKLNEDIELLDMAGDPLDLDLVRKGQLTPMFFGSAMNNFGVETFLGHFLDMTNPPAGRETDEGVLAPETEEFSGFIFKIQANMNPAHRDRLAFLRVCTGKFDDSGNLIHQPTGKAIRPAQPQQFMAGERAAVEEAWPGDIVGLFDPGFFRLGDTLYRGKKQIKYKGIPNFAPEHFARARADSLKRKQFLRGMTELAGEGAIQLFWNNDDGPEEMIAGAVGMLQFDVLTHRMEHEYGVQIRLEPLNFQAVRWIVSEPANLNLSSATRRARDRADHPVLLFDSEWAMRWALERNEGLELSDTALL